MATPLVKSDALDFLRHSPLNINTDMTLAIIDNNSTTLLDVYNPAFNQHGVLKTTIIKTITSKFMINKYWRRKNMTGVNFTTAVVIPSNIPTEKYLLSEENRKENSMHRFQSVTIRYCKEMYNFSLTTLRTTSWGYLTSSGYFDGLVGLLEQKKVDFGSSPLIYKLDRMPVVDYSYGNWILKSTFIYRKPKILEKSYAIFLRPLSTNVWCSILGVMFLFMIFLKISFKREEKILLDKSQVDASWSLLFLFTLGAFCQQGATCHPRLFSSRTLSIFVFLFCILIYQFYSASIVSYLLMDPPRQIKNLRDLSDSNLNIGIEDILIDRNYFVQTTDPVAIDLYNKKIKGIDNYTGWYSPDEGLKLVKQGRFAFHVETSTGYPIIEETFTNEEICELEEVQMYKTQPMHTNLQKNSPFREMMNYCMLHQVENGIIDRLRKYWDARKPTCLESSKKVTIHVGLAEFSSGLLVLAYGILLSSLILLLEIIHFNKKYLLDRLAVKVNTVKIIEPFVN